MPKYLDTGLTHVGIHGLATLKAYREVNPNASILVVDKDASLGGVWSKQRLYPGLHTNNHFKTFVDAVATTMFGLADHVQI